MRIVLQTGRAGACCYCRYPKTTPGGWGVVAHDRHVCVALIDAGSQDAAIGLIVALILPPKPTSWGRGAPRCFRIGGTPVCPAIARRGRGRVEMLSMAKVKPPVPIMRGTICWHSGRRLVCRIGGVRWPWTTRICLQMADARMLRSVGIGARDAKSPLSSKAVTFSGRFSTPKRARDYRGLRPVRCFRPQTCLYALAATVLRLSPKRSRFRGCRVPVLLPPRYGGSPAVLNIT